MVVTMDKDFGELVYHSAASHSGMLLLRLDDATGRLTVGEDVCDPGARLRRGRGVELHAPDGLQHPAGSDDPDDDPGVLA